MKKILALMLALIMALSCAGVVAEEEESAGITFELPAVTVTGEANVNVEGLLALLPMLGVDESSIAMAQAILPLIRNVNMSAVLADNGLQLDLGFQGQSVFTLAGEMTEDGIAAASTILPSYALTLSNETIQSLMEQFTGEAESFLANVDVEALAANGLTYVMEYVQACIAAVTMGEPELGEFAFEEMGYTFNCRTPILVDVEAIKTAVETMIAQFKADEAFGALFAQLQTMGLPINLDEEITFILPELTIDAYANVDEEGSQVDDVTYVEALVAVTEAEETVTVCCDVLVEGEAVTIDVAVAEQEMAFSMAFAPTDDGFACSFYLLAEGMEIAENVVLSIGETIVISSEEYFMDMETPLVTETIEIAFEGQRTYPVLDETKTVFSVEQLLADETGETVSALLMDVQTNGLGNLLAVISQIMPNEFANLMTVLNPTPAVEEAAE